ncbi:hypothetical protein [Clostridium manihotivorum]|uniref:Uncharacterized protein n=1 Tax=Clostridium manihotivorum TaxID=2320868 RepID=A0A3R5QYH5_9CLOT|nr:hypothetical protein [Clostridium manihotivorum]QAA32507.1 hypothetical protein C1I91_13155 [Clostridium manihotivorum]
MSKHNIRFHCEKCGKEITNDETNLYIYKDISDAPKNIHDIMALILKQDQHLSKNFCSNKCYNLFLWEDRILRSTMYNVFENESISKLLTPPEDFKSVITLPKEELEAIEGYIEKKIEYIKENL